MASKILKRARILYDLGPLLLSHHAFCKKFSEHVVRLGRVRLCIGCMSIYPAFAITAAVLLLLRASIQEAFPIWYLFFIGIPFVALRFLPIERRAIHTMFNVGTGAGTGLMFIGLLLAPTPWPIRLGILAELALLASLLYFIRFKRHLRICDKVCRYQRDWSRCPGFKNIHAKIAQDLE